MSGGLLLQLLPPVLSTELEWHGAAKLQPKVIGHATGKFSSVFSVQNSVAKYFCRFEKDLTVSSTGQYQPHQFSTANREQVSARLP